MKLLGSKKGFDWSVESAVLLILALASFVLMLIIVSGKLREIIG